MTEKNHIIILAGGKGSRMGTDFPKVLQTVKGRSIIERILESVKDICSRPTIIVGYKKEEVMNKLGGKYRYIWQKKQLGTGHAIQSTKKYLYNKKYKTIFIMPGDHPLISAKSIKKIIANHNNSEAKITLATVTVSNFENDLNCFYNCGRIIRNEQGTIQEIIELKDANNYQKGIKEVNVSYYCFNGKWLWNNIDKLENNNAAGEYYLTDMIELAKIQKEKINSCVLEDSIEGMGVNNMEQLQLVEKLCRD